MRKTLLTLLASACIVGAFENPAHSADAIWKQTELWTITGHTDNSTCVAAVRYPDGISLFVGYDGSMWSFSVFGAPSVQGETRVALVAFDDGTKGNVTFVGLGDGLHFAGGMSEQFMRSFATAGAIYVEGIGSYNLKGSAEATIETVTCQSALSESRVSRAWGQKPTDVGV